MSGGRSGRPTPPEDIDRAIALVRDGATIKAAANAIGVSAHTLRRNLRQRGLESLLPGKPGRRGVDPEAIDHAIALLRSGETVANAAAAINVSPAALRKHLHRRGLADEFLQGFGRRGPRIPEAAVDQAIAMLRAGATMELVTATVDMNPVTLQQRLKARGLTIDDVRGPNPRQPIGLDRLRRLIHMLVWLSVEEVTGGELADYYEIDRERIKDDIRLLRAAGVEITAKQSGGYRAWLPDPERDDPVMREIWERFTRRV